MADFSTSGFKNLVVSVLGLSSGGVSSSLKRVQDGNGNDTGLQLSDQVVKADIFEIDNVVEVTGAGAYYLYLDPITKRVQRSTANPSSDASSYDSGWKPLTTYVSSGGTWGLYPISNVTNEPQYRIINRTVHFQGDLVIPLASGGDVLDDFANYYQAESTDVGTTDTGITVTAATKSFNIQTAALAKSATLYPDTNRRIIGALLKRVIVDSGGDFVIELLASVDVELQTNGRLKIITVKELEFPPAAFGSTQMLSSQRRLLTNKLTSGRYNLDYTAYEQSTDDSTNVYADWNATDSSWQINFGIDGTDPLKLGGYVLSLDGLSYTIASTTSLQAIINADNS